MGDIIVSNYSLVMSRKPKAADIERDKFVVDQVTKAVKDAGLPAGYVAVIEATHTGVPNLKAHVYSSKGMEEAVKSFYTPTWKPLKLNHKTATDMFSPYFDANDVALGRVVYAEFRKGKVNTPIGVGDGSVVVGAYIPATAKLPDGSNVIDAIIDRRIINVSIGAVFPREEVTCSICKKKPLVPNENGEYMCDHVPGKQYDGKVCNYIFSNPEFEELSMVVDPADPQAFISTVVVADSMNQTDLRSEATATVTDTDANIGYIGFYKTDSSVYVKDTASRTTVSKDSTVEEETMTVDNRNGNNKPSEQTITISVQDALLMAKVIASLAEKVIELSALTEAERPDHIETHDSTDDAQENNVEGESDTPVLTDDPTAEAATDNAAPEEPEGAAAEDSGGNESQSNDQDAIEENDTNAAEQEKANADAESALLSQPANDIGQTASRGSSDISAYIRSRRLPVTSEKKSNGLVPFKIKL